MTPTEWHATAMELAEDYAAECVVADAQTGHGDKESAQLAISLAIRARAALSLHLLAYPVGEPVAFARQWHVAGETPKKELNENGRIAWPFKYKLLPVSPNRCLADDVPLYRNPKESA